jgi:sugar phosphate isomerase/epimerase
MTMRDLPLGAVIAFDFKTWNVADEIALLRQTGIRRVQIYRNVLQGITAESIRRTLDEAGLTVDSLHGYFNLEGFGGPVCDLTAADPAVRRAALDLMRQEADYARALGCRDIIVHIVGPGDTAGDAFRRPALAESAPRLAAIGREADVRFLIENLPPSMFGCDAAMLRRIVDEVNRPNLGLLYDSGHAMLTGDPVGIIQTMGPRLWAVHLHDTRGKEDDHLIPGMGIIPFEDVARALAEVQFAGTFMLEIYRTTEEVRRDLTPERLAHIERLRQLASGK